MSTRISPGLAALLIALVAVLPSRADTKSALTLWNDYVDAAATAIRETNYTNALVLLKSALQTAEELPPEDPRRTFTRQIMWFVYREMGQDDEASKVLSTATRLDVSKFDASLAPFSNTLDRLANTFYERYDSKKKGDPHYVLSERCLLLESAIRQRALPKSDTRTASTLGFFGLVLMKQYKLEDAAKRFEEALDLWEAQAKRVAGLGESRISLFQVEASDMEGRGDNPIVSAILLARTYRWMGDDLKEKKETQKSAEMYQKAERRYKDVLQAWEAAWPIHRNTARASGELGTLYLAQERYALAEPALRKSLAMFEAVEGPDGTDLPYFAGELAKVLRKNNHASEADAIERRFKVKKPDTEN